MQSFGVNPTLKQQAEQMEETFAKAIGFPCAKELYRYDVECLLRMAIAEHDTWIPDSHGQLVFQTLMQKVGDLVCYHRFNHSGHLDITLAIIRCMPLVKHYN